MECIIHRNSTGYSVHCSLTILLFPSVFSQEYCDNESFEPHCQPNESIVIVSAIYGHMKQGRCIEIDTPYFGCETDVKHILEKQCSGKPTCAIEIDDDELTSTKPCSRGISVYLDAVYACVKGKEGLLSLFSCLQLNFMWKFSLVSKCTQYIITYKLNI